MEQALRFVVGVILASMALTGPSAAVDQSADVERMMARLDAGDCRSTLKLADRILAGTAVPVEDIGFAASARLYCLYQLKRPDEARVAALALAEGRFAEPFLVMWLRMSASNGEFDHSAEALERLIAINPAVARGLDPALIGDVTRAMAAAKRSDLDDRLVLRLADIGFGGDNIPVRDSYMASAVRQHLKAGRVADAERLARQITAREQMIRLLTDRRAEQLWPLLEASTGPGMARTNRATAEAMRNHVASLGPAEESAVAAQGRLSLMQALWDTGDREGALAEGARALTSAQALAAAGENQGWLLNHHAMLLAAAGDIDGADERFRSLTELSISERAWLISMRINRALTLLEHGKAAAVVPQLGGLVDDAARFGTPYARQLVRWIEICALVATSKPEAAAAKRETLLVHGKDAPVATAKGLQCLGDPDGAARVVRAALEGDNPSWDMVEALQPEWVHSDPRIGSLRPLMERPDVAVAFQPIARDLPESFRSGPGGI